MITTRALPVPLGRARLRKLAEAEYERLLRLLDSLQDDDWEQPTDCPAWTVREMVAHMLGAAEGNASLLESARQMVPALLKERHRVLVDRINDIQVRKRNHLSPAELVALLHRRAPEAVAGRWRFPGPLRGIRVPDATGGQLTMGHLMDTVYTRDVWIHRIDISRATGRPLELTAGHDGVLVSDVVREWAGFQPAPFLLELTGPAGGEFSRGAGGPVYRADAIDFCRALSGRGSLPGVPMAPISF